MFKDTVTKTSYYLYVGSLVVLLAFSIVHTLTKFKEGPVVTDTHMILSALAGTSLLLLFGGFLNKIAK